MDNLALETDFKADSDATTNVEQSAGPVRNTDSDDEVNAGTALHLILGKVCPSQGMLIALLSSILYTGTDISVAISTQKFNPHLVVVLYSSVIFVLAATCLLISKTKPPNTGKQFAYLLICGGLYATGATFIVLAISEIPVGDAVSILNSMPVFAGAFGWIFLGQALRVVDIFFSILCIVGVTLIARPSFIFSHLETYSDTENDLVGVFYAMASAVAFVFSFIMGKKLQDLNVGLFYIILSSSCFTLASNTVLCTALQLFNAPSIPQYYWAFIFTPGVFIFFAQLTVFRAVTMERAVVVTIVLTSEIIFTFTLQILLLKITPHWYSVIGATCIVITCIGMATRKEGQTNLTEVVV